MKFLADASRERFLLNRRDLISHRRGEKCLPKTSRPGLIPTVRPDLPQPTHWLEEEDTLRSILFLRLKACHLHLKDRLTRLIDQRFFVCGNVMGECVLTQGDFTKNSFFKRNAVSFVQSEKKFQQKIAHRFNTHTKTLDFGGSRRKMGNEHSAICSDSAGCCGRSSSQRSEILIDIVISKESRPESRPTSRTSPLVEFDRSAWLREPQEPNNKPPDESPDRLGDLQAARADRRRAYAVPVHPVAALTLRQFAISPLLYLQP